MKHAYKIMAVDLVNESEEGKVYDRTVMGHYFTYAAALKDWEHIISNEKHERVFICIE